MRQAISEADARRLLGGGPVVLVSTSFRGNTNVMPAAFVTPLSFDPPLVGLAVHPSRHTHDMIRASQAFALNIPSRELLDHCMYLGSVSGRDVSKLELTKLPTFRARLVDAPLLEGCVGYIECSVEDAYTVGDHTLFIGKVIAAQVEADVFDGTWRLEDADLKPLHYLGLNHFAMLEKRLEARVPQAEAEASTEEQVEAGAAEASRETRERREREAEERERTHGHGGKEGEQDGASDD